MDRATTSGREMTEPSSVSEWMAKAVAKPKCQDEALCERPTNDPPSKIPHLPTVSSHPVQEESREPYQSLSLVPPGKDNHKCSNNARLDQTQRLST